MVDTSNPAAAAASAGQTKAPCVARHKQLSAQQIELQARSNKVDEIKAALTAVILHMASLEREAEEICSAGGDFASDEARAQEIAETLPQLENRVRFYGKMLAGAQRALGMSIVTGLECEASLALAQDDHLRAHRAKRFQEFIGLRGTEIDALVQLYRPYSVQGKRGWRTREQAIAAVFERIARELRQVGGDACAFAPAPPLREIDGVPVAALTLRALDADRAVAASIDPEYVRTGVITNREKLATELIRQAADRADAAQSADAAMYRATG